MARRARGTGGRSARGGDGHARRGGDGRDGGGRSGGGERSSFGSRGYPRAARVNEVLRQVLADELERMEDVDEQLGMLTITAVECDPDLRHATVLLSSLSDSGAEALAAARVRLQAAISREVRLKRTPQLRFAADPAVAEGQKIEDILRGLTPATADPPSAADGPDGPTGP